MSLVRKYNQALESWEDSHSAFELLDAAADPGKRDEWKQEEEIAMCDRDVDRMVMDIFNAKVNKGESWFSIILQYAFNWCHHLAPSASEI